MGVSRFIKTHVIYSREFTSTSNYYTSTRSVSKLVTVLLDDTITLSLGLMPKPNEPKKEISARRPTRSCNRGYLTIAQVACTSDVINSKLCTQLYSLE